MKQRIQYGFDLKGNSCKCSYVIWDFSSMSLLLDAGWQKPIYLAGSPAPQRSYIPWRDRTVVLNVTVTSQSSYLCIMGLWWVAPFKTSSKEDSIFFKVSSVGFRIATPQGFPLRGSAPWRRYDCLAQLSALHIVILLLASRLAEGNRYLYVWLGKKLEPAAFSILTVHQVQNKSFSTPTYYSVMFLIGPIWKIICHSLMKCDVWSISNLDRRDTKSKWFQI